MASTCCQPITDNCLYGSIFESGIQSSIPPVPSDTPLLGFTARFNLSTVDKLALMDDCGLQSPRAVGRSSSSSCRAEPSEDAEIFDSDDDGLLFLSKILVRSKQVIDLTLSDDDDGGGNEEGVIEVSWLRKS